MIKFKSKKSIDDEIIRLLAGFSQMHLPALMDELNKWHPPVDVIEVEDKLIIIAEIAGMSIENIKITQNEDIITIQGTREETTGKTAPVFHHMEINYGPFERNIKIPTYFVDGKINAKYRNGFLQIEIERAEITIRKIEIE
ncbi:hypothetical protein DRQ33_05065 [bacterium]|nr:MAG: hypothetical protein DRQ33_05065 [bacterium]